MSLREDNRSQQADADKASEYQDGGSWDALPPFRGVLDPPRERQPLGEGCREPAGDGCSVRRKGLKEPFCGLSHFAGIVFTVLAVPLLMYLAGNRPWHLVGFALYGVGLLAVYTASTLYHSLHVGPRAHNLLLRLDYAAIFLLIAGTYAPLCLVTLRGPWGWSLIGMEYTLALLGMTLVLCRVRVPEWVRVGLNLVMGWAALVAFGPLQTALPLPALVWLVSGGLLYTVGAVILATDRPHLWPGRFSAHDLWHLFVLGGTACHFILILRFVVPAS